MVEEHQLPHRRRQSAAKPTHVGPEGLPALGGEPVGARALRVGHHVVGRLGAIGDHVADLSVRDPFDQPVFEVRDRDARVEVRVAELFEVLCTQKVVRVLPGVDEASGVEQSEVPPRHPREETEHREHSVARPAECVRPVHSTQNDAPQEQEQSGHRDRGLRCPNR